MDLQGIFFSIEFIWDFLGNQIWSVSKQRICWFLFSKTQKISQKCWQLFEVKNKNNNFVWKFIFYKQSIRKYWGLLRPLFLKWKTHDITTTTTTFLMMDFYVPSSSFLFLFFHLLRITNGKLHGNCYWNVVFYLGGGGVGWCVWKRLACAHFEQKLFMRWCDEERRTYVEWIWMTWPKPEM